MMTRENHYFEYRENRLSGPWLRVHSGFPRVDESCALIDTDDLTVVGAAAAAGLPGTEVHILYSKVEVFPPAALSGQNGHTQCAHQMSIGVYNDLAAQGPLKGGDDALVLADAALEHHGRDDLFSLAHVIEVVGRHGVADTRDDVLPRVAHLNFVNQVGLSEDGTPGGNLGGMGGAEGVVADFLHLDAQTLGLAGEEGPGARSAGCS